MLFSPSDRWRSLDNNDNNNTTRSTQAQQESNTSKSIAVSECNGNTKNNLYCTPCKKKFSNEATFQGHLKSAKHIANEKKNKPKKTGSINATGRQQQQQQPQDPAVKDGLNKLKQATTVAKSSNPVPAVGVLWNLTFYTLKRPQNTYQALQQLIETLEILQSSSTPITGLTPSQIMSTLYASRLALARLLCIYKTDTSIKLAHTLYLDALQDKWKIDCKQLIAIAQECDSIPMDGIMAECRKLGIRYIEREEKREVPAPAKSDKNQSFVTILTEAIGMFQTNNRDDDDQRVSFGSDESRFTTSSNNIAIILLNLTTIVSKYETGYQGHIYMDIISEVSNSGNGKMFTCIEMRVGEAG
ncbi:hypothetical protein INT45_012511 [Circinella minor]|uniref:C2H2-type domain-containing protein n=1 Tax=Circinella minor TaxID=1195481 RepID=A0A8H7RV53_9FUNG|nr:hypothetical protein INT45_012511 [Circinella minor]